MDGMIWKALSGFYYVNSKEGWIECRAPGKFRHRGLTPMVGDWVHFTSLGGGKGRLEEILSRRNLFLRPAVANVDQLVLVATQGEPATDPFLLDRVAALAEQKGCPCVICLNKWDVAPGEELAAIYRKAGFPTVCVSAKTGYGMEELGNLLQGKFSVLTGNSGVGKSTLLNCLSPEAAQPTGEISQKLGRGRHTTRHIQLFPLANGGVVGDTPGFSSFEVDASLFGGTGDLARSFREFQPYLGSCQFQDCTHRREKGCQVVQALRQGAIGETRYQSYVRLWEQMDAYPIKRGGRG